MQDGEGLSRNGYLPAPTVGESWRRWVSEDGKSTISTQESQPRVAPETVATPAILSNNVQLRRDQQRPIPLSVADEYLAGPSPLQVLPAIHVQNSFDNAPHVKISSQTDSSNSRPEREHFRPWGELDWVRWHQQSGMRTSPSSERSIFTAPAPSQTVLPPLHSLFSTSLLHSTPLTQRQYSNTDIPPPMMDSNSSRSSVISTPFGEPSSGGSTVPVPAPPFPLRNLPPLPNISIENVNMSPNQSRPIAIPVSRKKALRQSAKISCTACLDRFDILSLIRLSCNCNYCSPCLNRLVESACKSAADFPPRCHGRALRISIYGPTLTSEVSKRYKQVEAEFSSQNPLYCAKPRCSTFIKREDLIIDDNVGICTKCNEYTCTGCRMLLSEHRMKNGERRCPSEPRDVQALRNLSQQEYWMQCPACRSMVEKLDGCDHIACICGVEFCYHCGSHFDEDDGCECDSAERHEVDESDEEDIWPDHRRMFDTIGRRKCWHLEHEATDGDLCHGCLRAPVGGDDFHSCNECHSVLCARCIADNNDAHIAWLEKEHVEGIKAINDTHLDSQSRGHPGDFSSSISAPVTPSQEYTEALRQHRLRMMEKWEVHREACGETWDEHVARTVEIPDIGDAEEE